MFVLKQIRWDQFRYIQIYIDSADRCLHTERVKRRGASAEPFIVYVRRRRKEQSVAFDTLTTHRGKKNPLLEQEKLDKDGRKTCSLRIAISRVLGLNVTYLLWPKLKDKEIEGD